MGTWIHLLLLQIVARSCRGCAGLLAAGIHVMIGIGMMGIGSHATTLALHMSSGGVGVLAITAIVLMVLLLLVMMMRLGRGWLIITRISGR